MYVLAGSYILTYSTGSTQVACYTKDFHPHHTIRSASCIDLLPQTERRCPKCTEFLNSMLHRHLKSRDGTDPVEDVDPTSHTNYRFSFQIIASTTSYFTFFHRFLSTPQKHERLRQFHSKARLTSQSIRRMEKRLKEAIQHQGIEVDDALHQDLSTIMAENSSGVKEQHPPGSFARIFWEQQEQASRLKNAKSMRWEPAMIRFEL